MSSVALSVLQQAIVKLCEEHDGERGKPGFRRCVVLEQYFIKYGSHGSLLPQYKTQQYIYEKAVTDKSAPRVPKVYDYFSPEHRMAYLVMEYIDAKPTPARNAPEKVAEALQWLRCLPPPPDLVIGPVGGGLARHELFKNYTAPLPFSSKEALQRYMNRALEWIPPVSRPKEIDFGDEWSVFTQSDMNESNFFIDTNDNMCMVDFEDVGLLPQSFASYTMCSNAFAKEVASHLDWSPTPNLRSMARACAILQKSADTTLGLDEHGWPKALQS